MFICVQGKLVKTTSNTYTISKSDLTVDLDNISLILECPCEFSIG